MDETRKKILPILKDTENLIDLAIYKLTNKQANACIVPMEDLGISDNIVRMRGGFYTGCFIEWNCDVPFVPVDTTVNVCGVSVFKLKCSLDGNEFYRRVQYAKNKYSDSQWNFCRGNHFIALCVDNSGTCYIVIHASDNTYKFGEYGLYPYNNSWYQDDIQTVVQGERYLRYIHGKIADKFYSIYDKVERSTPIRNLELCANIIGPDNFEQIVYSPHYGMPSRSSVAIGCQWGKGEKVLLTYPGGDIIVFNGNEKELYPHGFGMATNNLTSISYKDSKLFFNNVLQEGEASLIKKAQLKARYLNETIDDDFISQFLNNKPVFIKNRLHQVASFTQGGYNIHR